MTTNLSERSAKIYQFPASGRFAAGGHRDEPASDRASPRLAKVVVGGAWYHDEAIQEAERTRTR